MSWYITIRSDAKYSQGIDLPTLTSFLQSLPELVQTDDTRFINVVSQPWVSIAVVSCDSNGNYGSDERPQIINLVDMVCSYQHEERWYDSLAARIASFLRWEALEEHAERWIWVTNDLSSQK